MTAIRVLRFGEGFLMEPASYEHKQLAEQWTAWDPDHAGKVDPRFWLEQADDRDSYLVSDRVGPVLFFKVIVSIYGGIANASFQTDSKKVAELHMQFMPASTQQDHERIRMALVKGCPWLEILLAGAGVEEIVFDSRHSGLVAFSTKRLGFTTQGDGQLRKTIQPEAMGRA
jgi:hypothetical protein